MVTHFGTFWFLLINVLVISGWVLLNSTHIDNARPFDPYPFNFLNSILSIEAVLVSIFVLITQNREQKTAHTRDEIDLQVNVITEKELTRLVQLVVTLLEHQGIKVADDPELQEVLRPTNPRTIEKTMEEQIP